MKKLRNKYNKKMHSLQTKIIILNKYYGTHLCCKSFNNNHINYQQLNNYKLNKTDSKFFKLK